MQSAGKKIWRSPKDLLHSKSGKFFCNKTHQTLWRNRIYSGEKHAFWKGGESTYRKILIERKIPAVCVRCKEKDQRVLTVHHLDGDRTNNKVKNLVWLCLNCHHLVHRYKEKVKAK